MRFKLKVKLVGNGPFVLPVNYQYPLSAWIYNTIHAGNNQFATWLHKKGYMDNKRQYKLFSFSQLEIDQFSVDSNRLIINNPHADFVINFVAPEAAEPFIKGLFQQQTGSLGDKLSQVDFIINHIEILPDPHFIENMIFKTLSSVVVSKTPESRNGIPIFLHPEDLDFARIMHDNLVNKFTAWVINNDSRRKTLLTKPGKEFEFKLLSTPKPRLITIKASTPQQTKVRGYMMKFEVRASADLLRIGYYAGFGEKNSMGFGCVEVVG